MTIRERIQQFSWNMFGGYALMNAMNEIRVKQSGCTLTIVQRLDRIEGKIDELKVVPKANIHLRPPVPTDWDTAQLQALYDLSDKKEN